MSIVINSKLQLWRQKVADNSITIDEIKEAMAAIRKERTEASGKSDASRERKAAVATKAKAEPIDSEKLLGELF